MVKNINDVAKMFNITANKLRFYEKKGLLVPERHPENDYRLYGEKDLMRVQMILTYRALDLSLEDIKLLLDSSEGIAPSQLLVKQLKMVNQITHKYQKMQAMMKNMLNDYLVEGQEYQLDQAMIIFGQQISHYEALSQQWQDLWNFDNWAKTYDQSIKNSSEDGFYRNYHLLLDTVLAKTKEHVGENGSILDIGVGTGNLSAKFLASDYDVTGVDQSINMLMVAKEKFPNLSLTLGDFLKLPFQDHSFDALVTTYAFHHLNDEEKVEGIKEMMRVVKRGGLLVIGDIAFRDQETYDAFMATDEADDEEFYTLVPSLSLAVKKLGYQFEAIEIDEFLQVIVVKG